jgi:hypothetical protein
VKLSVAERRARLAWRHHLTPDARTDDVVGLVRDMVALHSSDPATVHLSALARQRTPDVTVLERALYGERSLVRMHGMRRTLFVVATDDAPVVQAACTDALATQERSRLLQLLADGDDADGAGAARRDARWLRRVERRTLSALERRGEAVAGDLSGDVPELAQRLSFGAGKRWAGTMGLSTRVLLLLAFEGSVVRGRPRGSWNSSQYRWLPMTALFPDGIERPARDEAVTELVRRWLLAFGPGTADDVKWWTGLTMGAVRAALAALDTAEVELDDATTALVLADDEAPIEREPDPWAALLPALDPTVMGWQRRDWYLGPHREAVFDRNGNAGPTVWWEGRVVGGWTQRKDGEIVHHLLEDVGRDARRRIEQEVERLATAIGDVRVTPRFRTPLEQRLST